MPGKENEPYEQKQDDLGKTLSRGAYCKRLSQRSSKVAAQQELTMLVKFLKLRATVLIWLTQVPDYFQLACFP